MLQNINNHIKRIAKLRAKGVPSSEINNNVRLEKVNPSTGSISGVVYESNGVTPIKGFCNITAFNEYGIYISSDYTSNYKNGEYLIEELPTGKYYVRAYSESYADEYYDDVYDWQSATFVEVIDGQKTSKINFILVKYYGSISGIVKDEKGNPIEFCEIYVESENGNFGRSTQSDGSGNYIISGLQTGNYRVQAQFHMEDKNYASEWYDNVYTSKEASLVSVVEPNVSSNINFILENGGAIKGKVLEPNGTSVYSYEAQIIAFDSKKEYFSSTETNDMGEFILTGLSPGNYKLQVMYNGMKNYVEGNYELQNWYDGEVSFARATPISVTISDTVENLIITLHEAGKIKGKVSDYSGTPIDYECEIVAYSENKSIVSNGAIVENGIYQIDKLPTGRYKLFANYFGYTQVVGNESMSEWYDEEYNFENAQFVDINAPITTENINFTLEKGGYISGRILNGSGEPLSYSGYIEVFNQNHESIKTSDVANDGMYFITGLPTGNYKLRMNYYGDENYSNEWYDGASNFESAKVISVVSPNQTSGINFSLENSNNSKSKIQGFITNIDGVHLTDEEHLINVSCFDANTGDFVTSEFTSMNGGYQLDLIGSEFKIVATSYYSNWMMRENNDNLAHTFYRNGINFNDPNTHVVSISNDSSITLNNLVMKKASGSISGSLFYENTNTGISENYIVLIFDEDGYLATGSSYNNMYETLIGEYTSYGLRPGNYYVLVTFGDIFNNPESMWYGGVSSNINTNFFIPKITVPEGAVPVVVTEGETKAIDFHLPIFTEIDNLDNDKIIAEFELYQNYPNPFNPSTTIKYSIPNVDAEFHLRSVTLKIYDILGREVIILVDKNQRSGDYKVNWDASNQSNGIYFCQLKAGDYQDTKKMILLK